MLYLVALLGGLITGVSPCVVPVLPVVMAGGATSTSKGRPVRIVLGLVVSFSLVELVGSAALSAIGLPQDFLYWLGIALLLLLAVGLLVPLLGQLLERPFARLGATRYAKTGSGLLLGLSLGLVFVPCAGPVLAAISVASANHRFSASSFAVTFFYAVGAAIPLLIFGLLAERAATGWQRVRRHLPTLRRVAGAVLAATTLMIAFGLFDPLQRDVPGYTSALENHVESSASIARQLHTLSGERASPFAARKPTTTGGIAHPALPKIGRAPQFKGIVAWLNTPGGKPLSLSQLRGKIVLVDFWTYSCINCQRSLPHVEAWYRAYKQDGLVVVGVHTPEFAFEHVLSNVRSETAKLGVLYPVAVDSNYGTWDAYANEGWPAEYLIDQTGEVRALDLGEGDYSTMEDNIRALLRANGAANLPPATEVVNKTPTFQITQESYLGRQQIQYDVGTVPVPYRSLDYPAPSTIPANDFAFEGNWTDNDEEATAGASAKIALNFHASDVYLVMGGTGTVRVSGKGPTRTIQVAGVPKLYTLFSAGTIQRGVLNIEFTPSIQAYDFTFG